MDRKNDSGFDVLKLKNLSVSYKTFGAENEIIRDFSMNIKRGETVCVAGCSGSGKSTLAMAIMGLLNPTNAIVKGEVIFDGERIDNLPYNKLRQVFGNRMSLMCQDSNTGFNPFMKVGRQIIEPMVENLKISLEEAKTLALSLLGQLGFENPDETFRCYPYELSGGMRQRAALAMAVICKPEFLILDEPTSEVDLSTEKIVLEFIKRQKDKYGMSVLLITHKRRVMREMADRVIDAKLLSEAFAGERAEIENGIGL